MSSPNGSPLTSWPAAGAELPRPVVVDNIGDAAAHVARIVAELTG